MKGYVEYVRKSYRSGIWYFYAFMSGYAIGALFFGWFFLFFIVLIICLLSSWADYKIGGLQKK